jgi:hypothetical protein
MLTAIDQLNEITSELRETQAKEAAKDVSIYREFLALLARGEELIPNQRTKLVKLLDRLDLTAEILAGDVIAMQTRLANEEFLAEFEAAQERLHAQERTARADAERLQKEHAAAVVRHNASKNAAALNVARMSEIRIFERENPRVYAAPVTASAAKAPATTIQDATHAEAMAWRP